jgi:hypothetical protein
MAAVLFYLSSSTYYDEISHVTEAVPSLVRLVWDGVYRGRTNALVDLLSSPSVSNVDDLTVDAATLLARLAEQPVCVRAMLASFVLVARLVDFHGEATESRSVREHCVALLASTMRTRCLRCSTSCRAHKRARRSGG